MCFASEINPHFADAFWEADLTNVICESQHLSGFNFSYAFVEFPLAGETIEQAVTYELVDGLLTITSKPAQSFVGTERV